MPQLVLKRKELGTKATSILESLGSIFGNLPRVAGWEQYSAEPLLIHLHHGNSPSPPSEASNLVFTVVDSGVLGRQAGNKGKKAGFIVLSSLPQALSLASVIYLLLPLTNVFLLHLSS